ncbi:hypothetical protein DsansV1_C24g0182001 [Dioscorea sansibarensis]
MEPLVVLTNLVIETRKSLKNTAWHTLLKPFSTLASRSIIVSILRSRFPTNPYGTPNFPANSLARDFKP